MVASGGSGGNGGGGGGQGGGGSGSNGGSGGGGSSSLRQQSHDVAKCATESIRLVRELNSAILITFMFPCNAISDALHAAGVQFDEEAKAKSLPKRGNSFVTGAAYKWCALMSSVSTAVSEFLKTAKDTEETNMLKDANDALSHHVKSIDSIAKLNTERMYCISRFNHERSSCIVSFCSAIYAREIEALKICFQIVFKIEPTCGTAPPTKAERKARRVVANLGRESS